MSGILMPKNFYTIDMAALVAVFPNVQLCLKKIIGTKKIYTCFQYKQYTEEQNACSWKKKWLKTSLRILLQILIENI